jgi:hypothetical protein
VYLAAALTLALFGGLMLAILLPVAAALKWGWRARPRQPSQERRCL